LRRRQEFVGNLYGKKIFSDYAHHPTEIQSTTQAFKKAFPSKSITILFQPHQGRRILEFWEDFKNVFAQLDEEVLIYPIYHAREDFEKLKKDFEFVEQLQINSFKQLSKAFAQNINGELITDKNLSQKLRNAKGDIILILSAGDIDWKVRQLL